jgi:hypothetical protein
MAVKKQAKSKAKTVSLDDEVQFGSTDPAETIIETPRGGAVAVAIHAAETTETFRIMITIRAGYGAKDIKFNFGSSGPQVRGGGDGDPPTCP